MTPSSLNHKNKNRFSKNYIQKGSTLIKYVTDNLFLVYMPLNTNILGQDNMDK